MQEVTSGSVRLNRRFFDEKNLKINKHKLSQTEQISYPTVLKYIYREDLNGDYDVRVFSGDVLFAILIKGMGYTPEEAASLKIGDVFEFIEESAK